MAVQRDEVRSAQRLAYLDNLKVLLVAGVIFGHAWAGYAAVGGWTYTAVRETSLHPLSIAVGEAVLGPFGLFVMGFFFLIAGLLTPQSLARKGSGRFAGDRLRRLGVPLLVFTVVLWPPLVYLMDRATGHRPEVSFTDPGHVWFVEVLLLFSLGYAAVWRTAPRSSSAAGTGRRWPPRRPRASSPSWSRCGCSVSRSAGWTGAPVPSARPRRGAPTPPSSCRVTC